MSEPNEPRKILLTREEFIQAMTKKLEERRDPNSNTSEEPPKTQEEIKTAIIEALRALAKDIEDDDGGDWWFRPDEPDPDLNLGSGGAPNPNKELEKVE